MKTSYSLIVIAAIIGLVTAYNIWVNSREPEPQYNTYTGYGFTFKYPEGMSFREDNFGDAPVSMEPGYLQGMISEDPLFVYMEVLWNTTEVFKSPEEFIEMFIQRVEDSPDDIIREDKYHHSTKDAYPLVFKFFNVTDRSDTFFKGVIGSWKDMDVNRYYMVTYLTTENVSNLEITDIFEALLDSVENM